MSPSPKISPAFEPFLHDCGANDKRDAIVIYRAPRLEELPVRGRHRALKQRLDYVKARASEQRPLQASLLERYQAEGAKRLTKDKHLEAVSIGSSALPIAKVQVTRKTLPALAEQPEVVAVLPNQRVHLIQPKRVDVGQLASQEVQQGLTWGLQQLDIAKAWETTRGKSVNVAVLDTGVYAEHPALAGRVKEFIIVDPLGRRISANPTFDCADHGTHVCGTIAGGKTPDGVSIGVAPEANLYVAGVLVGDSTLQTLVEGMVWAVEQGADILSMSLGFTYYEPYFAEFFKLLIDQFGVLPVVAIGNENHGNTSSPGNAHNALSVGAVEKTAGNKTDIAFFSSGASLAFPGFEPNALVHKPDVSAPGVQVWSCVPPQSRGGQTVEYLYMDGTSMATPHVSGVAALLMSAHPDAPVTDIIQVMKETAAHPGGAMKRPDNRWGFGMVQPVEALTALS